MSAEKIFSNRLKRFYRYFAETVIFHFVDLKWESDVYHSKH